MLMQIKLSEVDKRYFKGKKVTRQFLNSEAYDKDFIYFSL
jgi:hypothetical protein